MHWLIFVKQWREWYMAVPFSEFGEIWRSHMTQAEETITKIKYSSVTGHNICNFSGDKVQGKTIFDKFWD